MTYDIQGTNGLHQIAILARRPALLLVVGGATHRVDAFEAVGEAFTLRLDGRTVTGWRCLTSTTITVRVEGQTFTFHRLAGVRTGDAAAETGDDVTAAMPGVLVASHVAPGDVVTRGDPLLTIESMKLQMTIAAPRTGTVARIHVTENTAFERGATLASLMPLPDVGDAQ